MGPRLPINRDHHSDVAFYLPHRLPPALHYSPRTDLMVLREGVKDLDCISYSPNLSVYGPSPLGIKVIWASQTLEKQYYAKYVLYMKKLNLHSIIVFSSRDDETDNSLVNKYKWLKRSPGFDTKRRHCSYFFS